MNSSKFLASVAVSVVLMSGQAVAGFDWQPSVRPSVQTQEVESEPVAEVVMSPIDAEVKVETLAPAPASMPPRSVIQGFGHDVPLSYALTSIVPSYYGYAFGKDVDPALPISWKGGKAWDEVLAEALRDQELFAHIDAHKISIQTVAPTKAPTVSRVKTSREFAHGGTYKKSAGREVFVRRNGDIQVHGNGAEQPVSMPVAEDMAAEAPVDIIQMETAPVVQEEFSLDVQKDVTEEVIVERINPDIPVEVASYQSATDENVFEMVMSERASARVLDTKKVSHFNAKAGQTVRGTLEKWSEAADVQLYWETPYDFPVEKSMALAATYPMAVQALLGRYENHDPRPTVKLHPNWPHGPSILTVK
ncbi:MAG: TcpQ domain-containing protein [Alphaproteobacteria bacterium]|nr:TcpQ domain-containing protein [Alphaproteobacteria bacterium]